MKTPQATAPKTRGHFCSPEFEHAYMAQYDLEDQRKIRRRTQAEALRVRRTHGEPETESLVVGPPKEWEAQLAVVVARYRAEQEAMRIAVENVSGRDKAAGPDR